MQAGRPDWGGRTVCCIASGPSLTVEDCDAVRAAGLPTIVTNTSFRIAPWADLLFGFDLKWWREHMAEVDRVFKGRRLTMSKLGVKFEVETCYAQGWFRGFGNSGACSISIAVAAGATRILLLGYDCGFAPDGRKHWHGDHPKGMSNCASLQNWPKQFAMVADHARKHRAQVINCSRSTALTCFERQPLEQALGLTVEA